jgi:hypothetical protein
LRLTIKVILKNEQRRREKEKEKELAAAAAAAAAAVAVVPVQEVEAETQSVDANGDSPTSATAGVDEKLISNESASNGGIITSEPQTNGEEIDEVRLLCEQTNDYH